MHNSPICLKQIHEAFITVCGHSYWYNLPFLVWSPPIGWLIANRCLVISALTPIFVLAVIVPPARDPWMSHKYFPTMLVSVFPLSHSKLLIALILKWITFLSEQAHSGAKQTNFISLRRNNWKHLFCVTRRNSQLMVNFPRQPKCCD